MAYAIIVAGGEGLRMGSDIPKQYLMLNDRPVLVHTLQTFHKSGLFEAVVLILPAKDMALHVCEITSYGQMGPMIYVEGGYCRQESVYRGLKALQPFAKDDDIVCVHDAVRPIINATQIYDCIQAAKTYGAAVLGLPVTETVKRCDEMGCILETVPRDFLWLAKTPQAARYEYLWFAHNNASQKNFIATDDAALLEAVGISVYMVQGSRSNVKITLPEDLKIAAKLL